MASPVNHLPLPPFWSLTIHHHNPFKRRLETSPATFKGPACQTKGDCRSSRRRRRRPTVHYPAYPLPSSTPPISLLLPPPPCARTIYLLRLFPPRSARQMPTQGSGKAIVSNCDAQDFDYTPALEAQHCKRTIAPRAPSSGRCNFRPVLMREHIKR